MKYFNCNQTTFLVEFLFQYPNNIFICQKNGLQEVLKNEDKNGIKSIKIFDPTKNKFTVCSRKKILELMSYNTEFIEFSKTHYYFK